MPIKRKCLDWTFRLSQGPFDGIPFQGIAVMCCLKSSFHTALNIELTFQAWTCSYYPLPTTSITHQLWYSLQARLLFLWGCWSVQTGELYPSLIIECFRGSTSMDDVTDWEDDDWGNWVTSYKKPDTILTAGALVNLNVWKMLQPSFTITRVFPFLWIVSIWSGLCWRHLTLRWKPWRIERRTGRLLILSFQRIPPYRLRSCLAIPFFFVLFVLSTLPMVLSVGRYVSCFVG